MLAITLERHPEDMANVEQLRHIIQESLMSAEKLDLVPISESLTDVLKGIDLLLDWQVYPVRMTEFVLSLFDRVMIIAREVEESHFVDMRKTQSILVALQFIILSKNIDQIEQGIEEALVAVNQEVGDAASNAESDIEIELFGDDENEVSQIDIFVPEQLNNPLQLAREYIDSHLSEQCMLVLNNVADNDVQHTQAHTRFILELALAVNFSAGQPVENDGILKGICLHDIALSSIPHLLNKKGKYTPEEIEELKMHPVRSASIADLICESKDAGNLILHHHEHVDGSGYPFGLKGDNISDEGKLAALVDRFHDVMEKYPELGPKKQVLRGIYEINVNSGKRYDSAWVKEFNNTLRRCWLSDWNIARKKVA